MGVYDSYGTRDIQLKVGPCELRHFNVGDKVLIPDGIYVSYNGAVVIVNGQFCAEFGSLTDKWGGRLSLEEILDYRSPVPKTIRELGDNET